MTTNHHTPHDTVNQFGATGANLNAPLSELDSSITTNGTNIATNASGIATNSTNIATNASGIATNSTNIATNASGISTNASDIATNTANIATNTSNIAANAGGASATDNLLKAWAISGAWWHTAQPTYNATYTSLVSSVAIGWPDGSAGTYTAVTIDETWEETISFTVSHIDSGKTVSISKDARDEDGLETSGVTVSVA